MKTKELKQPLLSDGTQQKLKTGFLKSYLKSKYPSQYPSQSAKSQVQSLNGSQNEEGDQDKDPINAQEDKGPGTQRFDKQNAPFWQECDKKHLNFYGQASASYRLPAVGIQTTQVLKSNPQIFAAFSKADPYFKELELHELMGFEDYMRLSRIRLRNYISLVRTLSKIDQSPENYYIIKTKLNQVKNLAKYLKIKFNKVWELLKKDNQVYDLDEEEEEEDEEKKSDLASKGQVKSSAQEGKDQEEKDEDDSDLGEQEEYKEFFQQMKYCDSNNTNENAFFSQQLLREEEKWELRAQWLESEVERFKASANFQGWVPWIQAKLDLLADLDIPIKNVSDLRSSQVMYLQQYFENQIKVFDPEILYHDDEKTQIYENNEYPLFTIDRDGITNTVASLMKSQSSVREKLCFRQKKLESQTDYFLNVFERKPLGNEKIYEKRINTRGRDITSKRLEFHPKGDYLYFKFSLEGCDDEIQMVFPLNAKYKDPLLVKPGSIFLGFSEKLFYAMNIYSIPKETIKQSSMKKSKNVQKNVDNDDQFALVGHDLGLQLDLDLGNLHLGLGDLDLGLDNNEEEKSQKSEKEESETKKSSKKEEQSLEKSQNEEDSKESKQESDTNENEKEDQSMTDKDKLEDEDESEDESLKEEKKLHKILIYDLHDFTKVQILELAKNYEDMFEEWGNDEDIDSIIKKNLFGMVKEGFFCIQLKSGEDNKNCHTLTVTLNNYAYKVEPVEKYDDYYDPSPVFTLNEKGDKLLVAYWKSKEMVFYRYSIDNQRKVFKKDGEIKPLKDQFTYENMQLEVQLAGVSNDFLIRLMPKKFPNTTFLFVNDSFICQVDSTKLQYYYTEKSGLKYVYKFDDQDEQVQKAKNNTIKYQRIEQQDDSKVWGPTNIFHEIINNQVHMSFPYAYFIYNHDQVYMKDLTKSGSKGFQYLNSFMGINEHRQPIAIFSYTYNSKHSLQILAVNKAYHAQDFLITVHQIKTKNTSNNFQKFEAYLRWRVYAFTQDMASIFQVWINGFMLPNGKLSNELKIVSRGNCLNFEKWNRGKCQSRILVTNYLSNIKYQDRDTTNANTLQFNPWHSWCIIQQVDQKINLFTKQMKHLLNQEQVAALDSVWDYEEEGQNEIYSICVDTMIKNKIEIYLVYSNALARKFTSEIPGSDTYSNMGNDLFFEESFQLFNFAYLFNSNDQNGGGIVSKKQGAQQSKKLNLFDILRGKPDIFIQNNMLYSHLGFIDLNAKSHLEKFQTGFKIQPNILGECPNDKYQQLLFSASEAKIAVTVKCQEQVSVETQAPSILLFTFPLLNSRVLPQFNSRQFKHPIVPRVNKEKGYTSVFTLHIETYIFSNDEINSTYFMKQFNFQRLFAMSPGIIIKYFNGVEERIHMSKFGEMFSQITRFNQSQDGKFVIIVGTRLGPIEKDLFYNKKILQREHHDGIFLYMISDTKIELVKSFLFAEKKESGINEETKKKLNLKAKFRRTFVEVELKNRDMSGEYDIAHIGTDVVKYGTYYNAYIDFKNESEEYVEELRKVQEYERKKKQAAAIAKKVFNMNNKKGLIDYIDDVEEEGETEEQLPDITKFTDMEQLFNGFDLPYLQFRREFIINKVMGNLINQNVIEEEMNSFGSDDVDKNFRLTYEEDKGRETWYSGSEVNKINNIHQNMVLTVNQFGHVLLINRLANRLYLFYKCDNEFKVAKMRFDYENFRFDNAECDMKHLVVYENNDSKFRIYKIEQLFTCEDHLKQFELSDLEMVYDSEAYEQLGINKEIVGMDEESYAYSNIKLSNNYVIIKTYDIRQKYAIRVFDFANKALKYFIEGDRFILSGCKRYLWVLKTNMVYDIQNDLTTLFLWPGDLINLSCHDEMDFFNVSEDRSLMITQGMLHQAFNFISVLIDKDMNSFELRGDEGKQRIINQLQCYEYLYYKVANYHSILEKIFLHEFDKSDRETYFKLDEEEQPDEYARDSLGEYIYVRDQESDIISLTKPNSPNKIEEAFLKNLNLVLGLISNNLDTEKDDMGKLTSFILSFYSIDRNGKKDGTEKEPVYLNLIERLYCCTDVRIDIIEDILNYIVKQKCVAISDQVILKSFLKLLQNADTNTPFQDYLRNITTQTSQMLEIEKFNIAIQERGFEVRAHESPMIDNKFHSKVKQDREGKQDVIITTINFGNLLKNYGEEIMSQLTDQKYLAIMDIPFIQYLVIFQWEQVRESIKNKLLYPFFALLFIFTIYTMYTVQYNAVEEASMKRSVYISILSWINRVMLFLLIGYFMAIEVLQFKSQMLDYFSSMWNFSDIISYSLCFTVLILDMIPTGDANSLLFPARRITATLGSIILWIKLFYFLRIYDSTSRLIRMIIEIVNDMKNFMIVLLICICGFSNGFFILQQGISDSEKQFAGTNPLFAFIYTYRLTQGDFQLDNFQDLDTDFEVFLAWMIFIACTLFVVIVTLNLLIAIMGDTFSRVLENVTNLNTREKVMMVSENECLFNRISLFSKAQYLIILSQKTQTMSQGVNWDGQINSMKKQLLAKFNSMQNDLKFMITENQRDLRKRFTDQDDKSKRTTASSEMKISTSLRTEMESVIQKINELSSDQNSQNGKMQSLHNVVNDSQKSLKTLQDQVEQISVRQTSFNKKLSQVLGLKGKLVDSDED